MIPLRDPNDNADDDDEGDDWDDEGDSGYDSADEPTVPRPYCRREILEDYGKKVPATKSGVFGDCLFLVAGTFFPIVRPPTVQTPGGAP